MTTPSTSDAAGRRGGGGRSPPEPVRPGGRRWSRSTPRPARSGRWSGGRDFTSSQVNLAVSGLASVRDFGGRAASRFGVQAVHAGRRHGDGYDLNSYWYGPARSRSRTPTATRTARRGSLSNAAGRGGRQLPLIDGHRVLGEHGVRAGHRAARPGAGRRHGAPLGIRSHLDPVCSITLGTEAVNPLEMTNAYATLAAHGVRHCATPLRGAREPQRQVDRRRQRQPKQVLDPNDADLVTYALQDVVSYGTGTAAALSDGRPPARPAPRRTSRRVVLRLHAAARDVRVGRLPEGEIPMQDVEGVCAVFGGRSRPRSGTTS